MKQLEYKGYIGSVETDFDDDILFGKLLHIRDLVTYEAESPKALNEAFREAVDDYLADCEEEGYEPDKPFKGVFNVRVKPELHKELVLAAKASGFSLNEYVGVALKQHSVTTKSADDLSKASKVIHGIYQRIYQYREPIGASHPDYTSSRKEPVKSAVSQGNVVNMYSVMQQRAN